MFICDGLSSQQVVVHMIILMSLDFTEFDLDGELIHKDSDGLAGPSLHAPWSVLACLPVILPCCNHSMETPEEGQGAPLIIGLQPHS